ncbi:hypothetical protein VP01_2946g3 [Puccinia sorghi]|uniref:Uncharacterized protein n=1 Tax=Puccinia sorghi TaxID=27349 RepID=A0A0L6V1S5_9BASI|nr:hypothetical protein VP01_2946g3 [Puccinia sorghi]
MPSTNNIPEHVVNIDIISKDIGTCTNKFELAYFKKVKEQSLRDIDKESTPPPSNAQSTSHTGCSESEVSTYLNHQSQGGNLSSSEPGLKEDQQN